MKKYLKKGTAWLLTLVMALSTLTCLAMAEDDSTAAEESGASEITVYITCETEEIRPGYDETIDVTYSIGPVTNLTYFRCEVTVPDKLTLNSVRGVDVLAGVLFHGEGESSTSGRIVDIHAYAGSSFSSNEIQELFTVRYNVPADAEEGEVTFGLEPGRMIAAGGNASVNIVTEPVQIVVVDTSDLEREIEAAETMLGLKDLYSDASVAALEKALSDAGNILENIRNYYQTDVDLALAALTAAYDGLKTPAQELDAAIESASQLRESDYTADSWAAMTEALDAAKDIRDSESATSEDMNAAADTLYDAIDALVLVDDPVESSRKALEQLVQEAKELNEGEYSESTWTALQAAIEAAEKVLDSDDATKEELDDAHDVLALAMSRAQLEKTIEMAKLLSESDYDADSWAALQAAIEAAEAVLNDENATKQEVDDAYDALIEAMNAGNSSNTYPYSTNNGNGDTGSSGSIVTSPQTGDSNILLMSMFLLAAGMGTCAAAYVSKARRDKE